MKRALVSPSIAMSALIFILGGGMSTDIDSKLLDAFTPERIIQAFNDYKITKWDRFSSFEEPIINIPMGADGVAWEAFEKQLERNAANICRRIREGTYTFYPFREVNIPKEQPAPYKKPKERVLSVASVRDALVQAVLYKDILYQPLESLFRTLDSPGVVSFAYRRGKSAPQAGRVVYSYAQSGYWHVLDADLSKYFDTIPHDALLSRLAQVIGGNASKTYRLVHRFVKTDRVTHDSYKGALRKGKRVGYKVFHWRKPKRTRREEGVPQGGVLSGMLANLYLHDFDEWVVRELSADFEIKFVRYADDFIIMSKTDDTLPGIRKRVEERIESLGLKLNPEKTCYKDIRTDGLEFVGFHFDETDIRVRERNIDRYKKRVHKVIEEPPAYVQESQDPYVTLKWLSRRIRYKVQGRAGPEKCPKCGNERIGKPRSWMAFFQVVTDIEQLKCLDKWTREVVYEYIHRNYGVRLKRKDLRDVGFRSLVNERHRMAIVRLKPCLCDIDTFGLWCFVEDMFQGQTLETLARRKPFIITRVDNSGIYLSVSGTRYTITRGTIEQLWERLNQGRIIFRAELENEGYRNTSHIVAILAKFPGVDIRLRPIRLQLRGSQPASFLLPMPYSSGVSN